MRLNIAPNCRELLNNSPLSTVFTIIFRRHLSYSVGHSHRTCCHLVTLQYTTVAVFIPYSTQTNTWKSLVTVTFRQTLLCAVPVCAVTVRSVTVCAVTVRAVTVCCYCVWAVTMRAVTVCVLLLCVCCYCV